MRFHFDDCPNNCDENGMIWNQATGKFEVCQYCAAKRKKLIAEGITLDENTGDAVAISDELHIPNKEYATDVFEYDAIVPIAEQFYIDSDSLKEQKEEMLNLYRDYMIKTLPNNSYCFGIGIKGDPMSFCYPLMVEAYKSGLKVHRLLTDKEIEEMNINQEKGYEKGIFTDDVLFIYLTTGFTLAQLNSVKGVMELRGLRDKPTIIVTNAAINNCSTILNFKSKMTTSTDKPSYMLARPVFVKYTEESAVTGFAKLNLYTAGIVGEFDRGNINSNKVNNKENGLSGVENETILEDENEVLDGSKEKVENIEKEVNDFYDNKNESKEDDDKSDNPIETMIENATGEKALKIDNSSILNEMVNSSKTIASKDPIETIVSNKKPLKDNVNKEKTIEKTESSDNKKSLIDKDNKKETIEKTESNEDKKSLINKDNNNKKTIVKTESNEDKKSLKDNDDKKETIEKIESDEDKKSLIDKDNNKEIIEKAENDKNKKALIDKDNNGNTIVETDISGSKKSVERNTNSVSKKAIDSGDKGKESTGSRIKKESHLRTTAKRKVTKSNKKCTVHSKKQIKQNVKTKKHEDKNKKNVDKVKVKTVNKVVENKVAVKVVNEKNTGNRAEKVIDWFKKNPNGIEKKCAEDTNINQLVVRSLVKEYGLKPIVLTDKGKKIIDWRLNNPKGTKRECRKALNTNDSLVTVWWKVKGYTDHLD